MGMVTNPRCTTLFTHSHEALARYRTGVTLVRGGFSRTSHPCTHASLQIGRKLFVSCVFCNARYTCRDTCVLKKHGTLTMLHPSSGT